MGLVVCPECGSRISDRATSCPCCGYVGEDASLSISAQEACMRVYDDCRIEPWEVAAIAPTPRDQAAIMGLLLDRGGAEVAFPALVDSIRNLAAADAQYVAKITPKMRELLANGALKFQCDRNGELLAILRDSEKQVFRQQVRLEELAATPAFSQALNNLAVIGMLNQVLEQVRDMREAVDGLYGEFQNDRLALADASLEKLAQAQEVRDARLRELAVANAISGATDAKHQLMRSYEASAAHVLAEAGRDTLALAMRWRPGADRALDAKAHAAMEALSALLGAARIECVGWSMLGEYDAARASLSSLLSFVRANKLDDPDTLLLINESACTDQSHLVERFGVSVRRLEQGLDTPFPGVARLLAERGHSHED